MGEAVEEALEALKEASQAYIDVLIEDGRPLPSEADEFVQVIDAPAIAVTL
jgi:predicted RNase H-like HicB family nuclease